MFNIMKSIKYLVLDDVKISQALKLFVSSNTLHKAANASGPRPWINSYNFNFLIVSSGSSWSSWSFYKTFVNHI